MKIGIFGSLVGILLISQIVLADTDGADHVKIVINNYSGKPATAKAVKPVIKKPVTKTVKPAAKKLVAQKPVAKKVKVTQTVAVVPPHYQVAAMATTPVQYVPGKRVSLANPNSARANGFTANEDSTANPVIGGNTSSAIAPNLTSKIKKEEKSEEDVKWSFKLRSYNAVDLNALENTGATRDYTIRAWERLNVDYHITKDIWIGVMPQYYHTWFQDQDRPTSSSNPGVGQSYASYLGDTALVLNDKDIATFGPKFVFAGRQEYYAPTSLSSQAAGSAGETRTNLSLAKSVGKFDFKWTEEFRYYFQNYETNAYLDNNGKPIVNAQFRLLNLLDIGFNFTSKLSFTLETGIVNEGDYGDSANNVPRNYVGYAVMNPDLSYEITKNFGLSTGIWEVADYTNPPQENGQSISYTPFSPLNGNGAGSWSGTEVYLQGTVKF